MRGSVWRCLLGCLPGFIAVTAVADDASLLNAEGYRSERYRAVTPISIDDGETLFTDEALELHRRGDAVFIDVLGASYREPRDGLPGAWLIPKQRLSVPGAVWLPNVGYGQLSPQVTRYFRGNLERLTGGDVTRPLVFFCIAECWMSWNAARRAMNWGYQRVYWFRDGTDGWIGAGQPLSAVEPVELNTNPGQQ